MDFTKRFSIAHPEKDMENCPNHYYLIFKNTPKSILDEIEDIYFGKNFYYTYRRQRKFLGNAMGQEATDEHIDNLLRIQEEFGVEVSLTINQTVWPDELILDQALQDEFVEWVGGYYDKGLKSCTISSKHLMRTRKLQNRCPNMKWKNTVNHIISDGQQVADTIGTTTTNIGSIGSVVSVVTGVSATVANPTRNNDLLYRINAGATAWEYVSGA